MPRVKKVPEPKLEPIKVIGNPFNINWNPDKLAEQRDELARPGIKFPDFPIGRRNNMKYPPIIDSIGLEIETEQVMVGSLPPNLHSNWNEDHDASIESYGYLKNGILHLDRIPDGRRVKIGTELVSTILNSDKEEFKTIIKDLLTWITEQGEKEESFRAGIHVHVSMPHQFRIIKNIINLGSFMEQVFFYIGGMGYDFRGLFNDSTYCRPITKFGPSCVKHERSAVQCFNTIDLLNANSLEEFWNRYGGINPNNPPGKYNPMRYTWLTLYPLLTKGTIEFRIFNKTLNYFYLSAVVDLCKKFCEVCVRGSFEYPENSIYSPHSKEGVISTLLEFSRISDLSSSTTNILMKIINRTPPIKFNEEYFWSHLLFTKFNKLETLPWKEYAPNRISRVQIKEPNFLDIHRIEGE